MGNKCDLARGAAAAAGGRACRFPRSPAKASTRLREAILEAVAPARRIRAGDGIHHQPAARAPAARIGRYLEKARAAVAADIPHEMLLLDLYAALQPIDAITGATTADDILNRIFCDVLHREVRFGRRRLLDFAFAGNLF